jgi:SAM-dependent MidA family methyltransferase
LNAPPSRCPSMDPAEFGFAVPRPAGSVPEIEEAVREAVRADGGRLTYARFLQICLYHPARGYYAAFGPETDEHARHPAADYFTSVDLHPAFGHLVAREVVVHLEHVARETKGALRVVELGAGRGLLARDILQAISAEDPGLAGRVRYLLVEPNPGWVQIQRRNLLPEFAGRVEWVRCAGPRLPLQPMEGVVLANELLDALPFHVVEGTAGGLREVFVAVAGDGSLEEVLGNLSDRRMASRLEQEGVVLEPGQRGEVCLQVEELCGEVARAVRHGAVVFIDYGEEAASLYDARTRPHGTLRCFFRHRLNEQPLERLGRQDITAHVDFTAVAGALSRGGLKVHRLERQADFLDRQGLDSFLAKLENDALRLDREVYVRHRRALEALRDPRGLGRNLVLVAWR